MRIARHCVKCQHTVNDELVIFCDELAADVAGSGTNDETAADRLAYPRVENVFWSERGPIARAVDGTVYRREPIWIDANNDLFGKLSKFRIIVRVGAHKAESL